MSQATVEFQLGSESVTSVLDINLDTETIITGDFGGVVAAGTVARLRGNVRLIGNLHVRGTLLCDPTGVELDGQDLYDIHTHDGTLNLVGVEKTAWCRWGDTPVGWQVGDRLAVAPTKAGVYVPTEMTWQGTWASTTRPANSPDVTLVDGTVARPEVANLSQTVTLRNLKRVMVHEASAPNPQTFKWIRVLNSGETGVLGMYPIHFHMIGDHARGSTLEGVVVEGGKNHAFVPHASHGVTQTGCVAYNTVGVPYWWDLPPDDGSNINNTNDLVWDQCLALKAVGSPATGEQTRLAGFWLGAGLNMTCIDSVAACIAGALTGGKQTSGFHWPEKSSSDAWDFRGCVAHNNGNSGIFTWQNTAILHFVEDFTSYRNGYAAINHGAYSNFYRYSRITSTGDNSAVIQHAKTTQTQTSILLFEDIEADSPLIVTLHNSASTAPSYYRRTHFSKVMYGDASPPDPRTNNESSGSHGSWDIFEDCGLTPTDFDLVGIKASSIIDIFEGGVLTDRWQSAVWT